MDKIQKFLLKLEKKQRVLLLHILTDIRALNLKGYDVKPLQGKMGMFRLRKGVIRIVFAKTRGIGLVIAIAYRKDIYT